MDIPPPEIPERPLDPPAALAAPENDPAFEQARALERAEALAKQRTASQKGLLLSLSILAFAIGLYDFIYLEVIPAHHLASFFKHKHLGPKVPDALQLTKAPPLQVIVLAAATLMILGGGALSLGLLFLAMFIEPLYLWLMRLALFFPRRPMPQFKLLDFISIFALVSSLHVTLYAAGLIWLPLPGETERMGAQMLAHDAAMSVAIFAAVCIARTRAASRSGPRGFWTALSPEGIAPVSPLWKDGVLGLACFFFSRWVLVLTGLLMKTVQNSAAYKKVFPEPQDHFIVAQIAAHPTPWVLCTLLLTGTLGAAFFEETIYRGMLYNALKRFLGGQAAAVVGASVFAAMHGFDQDLLSLFTLGILMTWLYERTGRLFAGMVFHCANNLFAFILLLVSFY